MISVCIPNYNYEKYLGITIQSVLDQSGDAYEICIADNKSTDRSVDIIHGFQEKYKERIRYVVNPVNVGFAGNLDRAARLVKGDYVVMLSSDDRVKQNSLELYQRVINSFDSKTRIVISSCIDTIDSEGNTIATQKAKDFRFGIWSDDCIDEKLSQLLNLRVYRIESSVLLTKCLLSQVNPFNFCATCFSRDNYENVGGYGAGRLINPDKWFHWKLLSVADEVIFIDSPLFQYRWHNQNQTAQQQQAGSLKFLMDEYRNTIEITPQMLANAGIKKEDFEKSFINIDIFRHGIGEFVKLKWLKSLRILFFGIATYPGKTIRNALFLPYFLLLLSGPVGSFLANVNYRILNRILK